jgi:hypothetical protein
MPLVRPGKLTKALPLSRYLSCRPVECPAQAPGVRQHRTIHFGSSVPSVSTPNRPLPDLSPTLLSIPSMLSLRPERTSDWYDPATGFTTTAGKYDTATMVSSLAPSIPSAGTPKFLGATALPRLAFRGSDFSSLLADNHVGGSSGSGSSSSRHTSRSYATPRTPSRLGRIPENAYQLQRYFSCCSIPGAHPKLSRFPAPKFSATSTPYLTADDKENAQCASSDSYVTASERTPTESTYSTGSASLEPLSIMQ